MCIKIQAKNQCFEEIGYMNIILQKRTKKKSGSLISFNCKVLFCKLDRYVCKAKTFFCQSAFSSQK
jgi:hypothetical protein